MVPAWECEQVRQRGIFLNCSLLRTALRWIVLDTLLPKPVVWVLKSCRDFWYFHGIIRMMYFHLILLSLSVFSTYLILIVTNGCFIFLLGCTQDLAHAEQCSPELCPPPISQSSMDAFNAHK